MTLVVETGEGVAGANTLVDLQTYTGWLVSRGIAAPADDATGVIELVKAMDYLEEMSWRGFKVSVDQALLWPRYDLVDKDGDDVLSTTIPNDVKLAQIEIAYRIREGFDPAEQIDRNVSSESIDVLSVSYAAGSSEEVSISNIPRAKRLLKPFLSSGGGINRA